MDTETQSKGWSKSMLPGSYISNDGKWTATLRPAGYYAEFGCKLTRHYAIGRVGYAEIQGTARTLAEAKEMYL